MNDFIQHHSQRPDIIFCCVDIVLKSFRTHIKRATNISGFLRVISCPFCESKVSDLGYFVLEKNVRRFKVPVEKA